MTTVDFVCASPNDAGYGIAYINGNGEINVHMQGV